MSQQTLPFAKPTTPAASEDRLLPKSATPDALDNIEPFFYVSPNSHIQDLITPHTPVKTVDLPYASNISAGKNTYVYDAHTYHTKVPPQGISPLIEYYTRPGDVVLDPFCGSGMTGVAATELNRKAILSDLSPAAAFIAYNLNTPMDAPRYLEAVRALLDAGRDLERKLYTTHCRCCGGTTPLLYMVWSYGMKCAYCGQEFVLWDVAREEHASVRLSKIKTEFPCPHCHKHLKKRGLQKTRRYPVLVGYKCCQGSTKEATAPPNAADMEILENIEKSGIPADLWFPTNPFPDGVNTRQPIAAGITSVEKAYLPRALWAMASLWDAASRWPDVEVRAKLLFTLTSLYQRVTVFSEFRFWGGSGNTANFNVPAIMNEQNVFKTFERKANTISWYFKRAPARDHPVRVGTQSACHLSQLPDQSIDYVFTDPPFGSNINYSEMNLLWESWLGVKTNTQEEAIVNPFQRKGITEYRDILTRAFAEMRRVLKDNGWLTIVFHNSSEKVWAALQQAILSAGFVVCGTQTFDKKHGTFKQFVSDNTVGYDLVLHCRKASLAQPVFHAEESALHEAAIRFVRSAIERFGDRYIVRYLHVARKDELDYRRLYADWLADTLPHAAVRLGFAEFRTVVDRVVERSRLPDEKTSHASGVLQRRVRSSPSVACEQGSLYDEEEV